MAGSVHLAAVMIVRTGAAVVDAVVVLASESGGTREMQSVLG